MLLKKGKHIILWCLLIVLLLSACGSNTDMAAEATAETTEKTAETTEETAETTEETAETTEDTAEAVMESAEATVEDVKTAEDGTENRIPEEYALAVIVTINPQIRLYLNADNVIIGTEYMNEDAETAFADIDFTDVTAVEGIEKIIQAAAEKEFLTDGKEVNIEIAEIRDTDCDSNAICAEMETAAVKAVEENHVTAAVTTKVRTEPAAACSVCGGTGKCDECKGDGYRGSGYTVSCPRCHGSLTETCIYCDANGNSIKHEGTCDFPNCMGSHVYTCTICGGGTTPVTCNSCKGSGKCMACGGSGTK